MALRQLSIITLTKDYTAFKAGDQVAIFYDDVSFDIVVKKYAYNSTLDSTNLISICASGTFEGPFPDTILDGSANGMGQDFANSFISNGATVTRANTWFGNSVPRTGTYGAHIVNSGVTGVRGGVIARFVAQNLGSLSTVYDVTVWVKPLVDISFYPVIIGFSNNRFTKLFLTPLNTGFWKVLSRNEITIDSGKNVWNKLTMRVAIDTGVGPITLPLTEFQYFGLATDMSAAEAGSYPLFIDDISCFAVLTDAAPTVTTITSGDDLGTLLPAQLSDGFLNGTTLFQSYYNFCTGVDRTYFELLLQNSSFPYFTKKIEYSSVACGFVPSVCNLLASVSTITSPSTAYLSDGSFVLSVFTSLTPFRCTLNGNIPFESMENNTGVFSALSAGTYFVTIADSGGCRQTLNVVVPPFRSDGIKYRLDFKDIQNSTTSRIDILQKNFDANLTEVQGTDMPIKLSRPNISVNNKFEAILPTSAEIGLLNKSENQFVGLFTQTDKTFRVNYYRPVGTLLWAGFLQSSIFSEEFTFAPYGTSLKAIDGLATLKDYAFKDISGNPITTFISHIKILSICLKNLGLDLPIRSGVNTFETRHVLTDDPLVQTFSNPIFDFVEDDGTLWDCERVVRYILLPYRASLIQWAGRWNIIQIDACTQPYNYRDFDKEGVYISSGTFDPVTDIKDPSLRLNASFADNNHMMETVPAYGKITVVQKLFPKKNILVNGNFNEKLFNNTLKGWTIDVSKTFGNAFNGILDKSSCLGFYFGYANGSVNIYDGNNTNYFNVFSDPVDITWNNGDILDVSFKYLMDFKSYATSLVWPNGTVINVSGAVRKPDFIKILYSVKLEYNGTAFYFNDYVLWNSNAAYKFNTIYNDQFGSVQSFSKKIDLPNVGVISSGKISIQLYVTGSNYFEFNTQATLEAIATANVLPLGTKVKGLIGTFKIYYYELKSGTSATSWPNVVRPTDYATTTNEVFWAASPDTIYSAGVIDGPIRSILLDDVVLRVLPSGNEPDSEARFERVINSEYRENLTVEIDGGDIPNNYPALYNNFFRIANGSPTSSWALNPFNTQKIQEQLLSGLVNQYSYPSIKLSGNFLAYSEIGFLNVLKHIQPVTAVSIVNPEMTTTGATVNNWLNFGSGPSWTGSTNQARVDISATDVDTKFFIQETQLILTAGVRLRIVVKIDRSGGQDRQDQFILCFFKAGLVVQTVIVADYNYDAVSEKTIKVTLAQDIDNMGFYSKSTGRLRSCTYLIDYFRVNVLQPVRYYLYNSITREDRNNDLQVELMQIIPLVTTLDQTTIDDGAPNDNDPIVSSGAFSDGFTSGFLI